MPVNSHMRGKNSRGRGIPLIRYASDFISLWPKSEMMQCARSSTSTFEALRSPWSTPWLWRYAIPFAIW